MELWESDPFEPVVKNTDIHPRGAVFARGSSDDKGQLYMHVRAVRALIEKELLNCNIKFIYEGEEEVGSENLDQFCASHKELLTADVIMISDTSIISNEVPSITTEIGRASCRGGGE